MEENKFQREVLDRLMRLETKIDLQDYKGLSEKADRAETQSIKNKEDIEEIQEKIKWLSRTITAALITGVIGIVFILLKNGIGIK